MISRTLLAISLIVVTVLLTASTSEAQSELPFNVTYQACPSATACFVVGTSGNQAAVAYTNNSAGNWHRQTIPSGIVSLSGVSCSSPIVCTAVGQGQGPVAIHTANAGTTWVRQPIAATAGTAIATLSSVSCPSTSLCHAVGVDQIGSGVIVIGRTGNPWTVEARPATAGQLSGISCPNVLNCSATGFAFSGSDATGLIVSTRDGGFTWQRAYQFPASAAGSGTFYQFRHVSCSSNTCIAIGDMSGPSPMQTLVAGTSDSGATWQKLSIPSGVSPKGVRCSGPATCYISGDSSIIRTSDFGKTWRPLSIPVGVNDLQGITCGDPVTCYAFGTKHYIESANNGASWTLRSHP